MSEFLIFFKSLFSRSRFSSILTSLVAGLSVGLMVLAFNNPTGNPTTGGGVIGVNTGALANSFYIDSLSNVGIGTAGPGAKLEVAGQIKITGGAPGANKILTSDAVGLASWQAPSTSGVTLPSGAVFFMISGNCPSGTTDATAAYTGKFARAGASPGTTGGADTHSHTLATTNLPAHTHGVGTLTAANESAHTHSLNILDQQQDVQSGGGGIYYKSWWIFLGTYFGRLSPHSHPLRLYR